MKLKNIQTVQLVKIFILPAILFAIASCNKALPEATPIIYTPVNSSTTSIGDLISSDTSYSFFAAAAQKTGQLAQLSRDSTVFTVFLPNNNAFRASGIPSIDVVNSLPPQTLGGIVGYAIIPGRQFLSTDFTGTFPNTQLPTSITIGALPIPIPLKLSTFPSVGATGFYDNNIPVVKPDVKLKNGVVHLVGGIVAPPSQVLKAAMYSNPNLTYFKAAIARADSGQIGLNRLDSLLGYAVTNMTVLAPNNTAFQTLISVTAYGYLLQQGYPQDVAAQTAAQLSSSPDVFSNPLLFSALTATTVRGILVYHFLATNAGSGFQPNIRVFSNNFSSSPTNYTTLLNSAVPQHPGIIAKATFAGPFVGSLQFTGLGTFPPGGAPYSGGAANAIASPITHMVDNHAVNGVFFILDKVLLPQ
ncbi:MAG: fasciclin domain-containing protein [Ginsengibacter sp.]